MEEEKFREYASLMREIKEKKEMAEELKTELIQDIEGAGVEKVKSKHGSFTLTRRKTWVYTDKVESKSVELKELKSAEEKAGLATFTEKTSLLFK